MFKTHGAAMLASLLLVSCATSPPRPRAEPDAIPPPSPRLSGGMRYRLDPEQSELRLLVYRAGAMSALGHNHVIVNRAMSGSAEFAGPPPAGAPGTPAAVSFALTIPASGFVIDDARARAEEGEDFSEPVPEDAKAGTLHNMLSPAVLDAAEFPEITVQSETVGDTQGTLAATVVLKVAGHESRITVPFNLTSAAGRLTATGAFNVRQTAIGLVPLSVFLGALRVQDEMRVKFTLVAIAADQASGSDTSKMHVPSGAVNTAAGR